MIIREAREDELSEAVRYWQVMRGELGGHDADLAPDWLERGAAYYKERRRDGELRAFFAEIDGKTVGTATGFLLDGHPRPLLIRPSVGYIVGVYVVPEYRRRGIGRAVTDAAIDWLKSIGCSKIRLRASADGRALYRSMGFLTSADMELRLSGWSAGDCPPVDSADDSAAAL